MSVALVSATRDPKAGRNHRDSRDCTDRATRQRREIAGLLEGGPCKKNATPRSSEQPGIQHPLSAEDRLEVRRWFRPCEQWVAAAAAGGGAGSGCRRGEGTGGAAPNVRDRLSAEARMLRARGATLTGAVAVRNVRKASRFERLQPCGERGDLTLKPGQTPNGDEWDHEAGNSRHGGDRKGWSTTSGTWTLEHRARL